MPKRLALLALSAAMVALCACGTTVRGYHPSDDATGLGDGSSSVGASGSSALGGSAPSAVGTTALLGGSTAGGATVAAGLTTGSAAGVGPSATTAGGGLPPVSIAPDAPILLGVATYQDPGVVEASGFEGAPDFEGEQSFQTIIGYYNSHGGFGGHQVTPIYYQFPLESTSSYSSLEQSACADFTQDHHVVAVVSDRPSFDDVLTTCLATAHVPLITDTFGYVSGAELVKYPMYFPSMPSGERAVGAWITGLQQMGYFSPKAHVGVLYCDLPTYLVVYPTVTSDLAAIGVKPTATSELSCGSTESLASQLSASVLKFKAAGVDHVLIMDDPPTLSLLWPTEAESQGYAPRYGFNTYDTPTFVASNVSASELHGAIGVGWWPWQDVSPSAWPPPDAPATQCLAVYHAAGLPVDDGGGRSVSMWDCGMVQFFRTLVGVAPNLGLGGIETAVNSLGSSWVSPTAFRVVLNPSRHDGGAAYRDFAYNDGCTCFEYSSATLHPM